MKRYAACLLALLVLALAAPGSAAQGETKHFAVLPFQIHGPDKYQFLSQGIQTMLQSRLTWEGHYEPVEETDFQVVSRDIGSKQQAKEVQSDLGADFLFWGSATIVSKQVSMNLNILDADQTKQTESWQTGLDNLIPSLEERAKRINQAVFQRKTDTSLSSGQAQQQKEPNVQEKKKDRNPYLVYGEDSEKEGSGIIQRYKSKAEREAGRWRSRRLDFQSRGVIVGDANGDGSSEAFILTEHTVYAATIDRGRLNIFNTYEVSQRIECLNINLLDINDDDQMEVIVSAVKMDQAHSFILALENKQLAPVAENIDLFLSVVKFPPVYRKILIGQRYHPKDLFSGDVHRVAYESSQIVVKEALHLPKNANIFNFAYLPIDDDYKVIVNNIFDKLLVYSSSRTVQYSTDKKYAASTVKIKKGMGLPGLDYRDDPQQYYYISSRLFPCDLNEDQEYELLVNRNISIAADFLPRFRHYPKGEIHNLFWDGMSLEINWKTEAIDGTVVDYGIGDINNDQKDELYVCVNTYPGYTYLKKSQTIVMHYSLD